MTSFSSHDSGDAHGAAGASSPLPGFRPGWYFTLFAGVLVLLVLACFWNKTGSGTLLFHLKAGDTIQAYSQVPHHDIFSVGSRPGLWSYVEWFWAVVLNVCFKLGDWVAVSGLNVALAALVLLTTCVRARMARAGWLELLVVAWVMMVALLPGFQPVPVYGALVVFAVSLVAVEAPRLWPMAILPMLSLLWVNIHPGAVLLVLVPLALQVLPDKNVPVTSWKRRRAYPIFMVLACLVMLLANPHSVRIFEAYGEIARDLMEQWRGNMAVLFGTAEGVLRVVALVAFLLAAVWQRALRRHDVLVLLVLGGATVWLWADGVNFLLVYLAPRVALALTRGLAVSWQTRRVSGLAATALCIFGVAWTAVAFQAARVVPDGLVAVARSRTMPMGTNPGAGVRAEVFPEMAAGRLAPVTLRTTILNRPEHGDFLIWRLWPGWKVVVDGREELYSQAFLENYENVWRGAEGWEEYFALWQVNAVLGDTALAEDFPERNLYHVLADSPEWSAVFWDRGSIVYLRSDIEISATNLTPFRVLRPGISWEMQVERIRSDFEWVELSADLRRALADDPLNEVAEEFLRRVDERIGR